MPHRFARVAFLLVVLSLGCGTGATCPPEVDFETDPNHCGGCEQTCPYVAGSLASCVAAECVYECLADSADCNGDPSDGCEATLVDDPLNCGACDRVCPASLPRSAGACEAGECAFGCEAGWGDCNTDLWTGAGDGCEIDLSASADHCGVCGDPCPTGCVDGTCPGRAAAYCAYFGADLVDPRELALASDGTGFLLAVREHSTSEIVILRVDGTARPVGVVDRFADDTVDTFDLAHDGSNYLLVWLDGAAGELVGARYDALGTRTEDPTVVGAGEFLYAGIRAHDGVGEALVGVRNQGFWIAADTPLGSSATVRALPGDPDAKYAFLSPVAAGYVGVGTRFDTSGSWPDGRWEGTWTGFDAVMSEVRTPSPLDPILGLLDVHATTLVSTGSGALFAAVGGYSPFGVPALQVIVFDSSGQPGSPFEPLTSPTGPVSIGDLSLASDSFGVWVTHTSSVDPAIYLRQLDTTGSAMPWQASVPTRGGFLGSTEIAVGADGALVLWRWSSTAGGPDLVEVQGVLVRRSDLSVTRPCE